MEFKKNKSPNWRDLKEILLIKDDPFWNPKFKNSFPPFLLKSRTHCQMLSITKSEKKKTQGFQVQNLPIPTSQMVKKQRPEPVLKRCCLGNNRIQTYTTLSIYYIHNIYFQIKGGKEYFWDTKTHVHTYIHINVPAHTHIYLCIYVNVYFFHIKKNKFQVLINPWTFPLGFMEIFIIWSTIQILTFYRVGIRLCTGMLSVSFLTGDSAWSESILWFPTRCWVKHQQGGLQGITEITFSACSKPPSF